MLAIVPCLCFRAVEWCANRDPNAVIDARERAMQFIEKRAHSLMSKGYNDYWSVVPPATYLLL